MSSCRFRLIHKRLERDMCYLQIRYMRVALTYIDLRVYIDLVTCLVIETRVSNQNVQPGFPFTFCPESRIDLYCFSIGLYNVIQAAPWDGGLKL